MQSLTHHQNQMHSQTRHQNKTRSLTPHHIKFKDSTSLIHEFLPFTFPIRCDGTYLCALHRTVSTTCIKIAS